MAVPGKDEKKTVKTILCYGSSSTWGYDPMSGARFSEDIRWPCIMKSALGKDYRIIEEGLNGRTVLDHIPGNNSANGHQYLISLLGKTEFDFIIIFLGLNDLFADKEESVRHITSGIEKMVLRVKIEKPHADIIIVSPPQINGDFEAAYIYQIEVEKSRKFSHEIKHMASHNNCYFVDADKIVKNSEVDGIHFGREDHLKFGQYMADFIKLSEN